MSENPHALRVENVEYLNGSLFVDYQLRKTFEIWDRIYAQNWMSGNSYLSLVKLHLYVWTPNANRNF